MFITLLVPFYFLPPKINIRMGNMPINFMTMPKTSMNKYHNTIFTQHNIRRARQPFTFLR